MLLDKNGDTEYSGRTHSRLERKLKAGRPPIYKRDMEKRISVRLPKKIYVKICDEHKSVATYVRALIVRDNCM